jgi:hypothetical protein
LSSQIRFWRTPGRASIHGSSLSVNVFVSAGGQMDRLIGR